jgi:hypothetical protein
MPSLKCRQLQSECGILDRNGLMTAHEESDESEHQ